MKVVHEGLKEYKCEFCDKSFGTNSELKSHISVHHPDWFNSEYSKCSWMNQNILQIRHVSSLDNEIY